MGIEGRRRKKPEKEKKNVLRTIGADAILAAGVLAAAHIAHGTQKNEPLHSERPAIEKSDRADIYDREQAKLPTRFKNFRRSNNIIDRRFETEEQSMQPIDEYQYQKSRAEIDAEYSRQNSELTKQLDGRTMPRDTHSVNTWNKKNQIDHAIKKIQREVLLPKPHPHKKKQG